MSNPLSKQGAKATKEPWRDNYRTPQYILDAVAECFPNGYHDPFDYGLDATAIDWANYDGLPLTATRLFRTIWRWWSGSPWLMCRRSGS